jgi:hypothetical protein
VNRIDNQISVKRIHDKFAESNGRFLTMKIIFVFVFLITSLSFTTSGLAQEIRLAKIDSDAFSNEDTGIKVLIDAEKNNLEDFKKEFEKELKELTVLQEIILREQKAIRLCGFLCCDNSIYKANLPKSNLSQTNTKRRKHI